MADFGWITLGFAVWIGLVLLPPALAFWSWNYAPRYLGNWLPHLLFAPAILAVEWAICLLLFAVTGDTGAGPPGLGLALVPATAALLLVLVVYYLGLTIKTGWVLVKRVSDGRARRAISSR